MYKICKKCEVSKHYSCYGLSYNKDRTKSWLLNTCKECKLNERRKYTERNREYLNKKHREYVFNNIDKIKEQKKRYYINNREKVINSVKAYYRLNLKCRKIYYKNYYRVNCSKVLNRNKLYRKNNKLLILRLQRINYKNNPSTRIRKILSSKIRRSLNSEKKCSILLHLPYSIYELKNHLESQFEYWMNWNNYGVYRLDIWKDNDPSTWTWHIDHIIPHSTFKYTSMEDEEFKQCWSLKNLRPYSSKQNIIDGNRL